MLNATNIAATDPVAELMHPLVQVCTLGTLVHPRHPLHPLHPLHPPPRAHAPLASAHAVPALFPRYCSYRSTQEYVANLTTRFDEELAEAWERETWQPIDEEGSGAAHAAVVWDLFRLFASTLEVRYIAPNPSP